MTEIGKRVRQLREKKGLTPAEFAEQLGEKVQRLKDIERGKQRPPADFIAKVMHVFGADPGWLLGGAQEERGAYDSREAGGRLAPDEMALPETYRQLSGDQKAAVKAAVDAFASARRRKKDTG